MLFQHWFSEVLLPEEKKGREKVGLFLLVGLFLSDDCVKSDDYCDDNEHDNDEVYCHV